MNNFWSHRHIKSYFHTSIYDASLITLQAAGVGDYHLFPPDHQETYQLVWAQTCIWHVWSRRLMISLSSGREGAGQHYLPPLSSRLDLATLNWRKKSPAVVTLRARLRLPPLVVLTPEACTRFLFAVLFLVELHGGYLLPLWRNVGHGLVGLIDCQLSKYSVSVWQ